MNKILKKISLLLLACIVLSGCQNKASDGSTVYKTPVSNTSFMFDTVTTITLYSAKTEKDPEEIILDTFKMCKDLENKLSKTIETSDVSLINNSQGEPITVSSETAELINLSKKYYELSNGAFDITIAPLSEKWNFHNENPVPPSDDEISSLLKYVGMDFINIEGNVVTKLNPQTEIDLGGIAKGYIADKAAEYLISENITSSLINFGGNVVTIGSKPDNTPFKIGVQKPFADTNEVLGAVSCENGTIVTSGTYERYFEYEGEKYHHILDPKTGKPADSGLVSVTIEGVKSADADALSTSCFVLGIDKGLELIESLDGIEAVFVTEDGNITTTSNSTFEKV